MQILSCGKLPFPSGSVEKTGIACLAIQAVGKVKWLNRPTRAITYPV